MGERNESGPDVTRGQNHDFGTQDRNGVDIGRLRENLKLTPTQRLERMMQAQVWLRELERARATIRHKKAPHRAP